MNARCFPLAPPPPTQVTIYCLAILEVVQKCAGAVAAGYSFSTYSPDAAQFIQRHAYAYLTVFRHVMSNIRSLSHIKLRIRLIAPRANLA